jgi:hypothetical protein
MCGKGRYLAGDGGRHEKATISWLLFLVGAVAIGLRANSVRHTGSDYCPSPRAASVAALLAPCQTFDSATGRPVSNKAVQMGLSGPDEQPLFVEYAWLGNFKGELLVVEQKRDENNANRCS